jgi:hypothetical protein
MGLDMYMYNSKHTDINFEGDDDRCLYWRGQRQLHELFYMFGERTEIEGKYIFTKDDVIKMVAYILESVMNIHKAAMVAYDDMTNAEEKELPNDVLHREYYVAGRILSKAFENELRCGHSFNAVNIFDDFDGTMMADLINGLMKLLMEMKDDELITYLASY